MTKFEPGQDVLYNEYGDVFRYATIFGRRGYYNKPGAKYAITYVLDRERYDRIVDGKKLFEIKIEVGDTVEIEGIGTGIVEYISKKYCVRAGKQLAFVETKSETIHEDGPEYVKYVMRPLDDLELIKKGEDVEDE